MTSTLTLRSCVPLALPLTILTMAGNLPAQIDPTHLIVSINEFTGSSDAPSNIAEYTAAGTRVQILSRVPTPGGTLPTTDQARDLLVGPDKAIYLYNGTFDPYLARFDLATRTWSQTTFSGWSTVNNGSYGGLTGAGQYLYAADMRTFGAGDTPQGIVRFDTAGGPPVRFAESVEPNDLSIGPDGILYALDGGGSPRNAVYKFDPITFAPVGTMTVPYADYRGVAAAADGSVFLADWSGGITRFSADGTLLDSLLVPNAKFSDIDINADGQIALGTGFDGEVVVTDLALDSFTRFRVTDSTLGGDTFVSWATPVPEPGAASLLTLGAIALIGWWFRRRHQPAP